jgi:hypothetical protein
MYYSRKDNAVANLREWFEESFDFNSLLLEDVRFEGSRQVNIKKILNI